MVKIWGKLRKRRLRYDPLNIQILRWICVSVRTESKITKNVWRFLFVQVLIYIFISKFLLDFYQIFTIICIFISSFWILWRDLTRKKCFVTSSLLYSIRNSQNEPGPPHPLPSHLGAHLGIGIAMCPTKWGHILWRIGKIAPPTKLTSFAWQQSQSK